MIKTTHLHRVKLGFAASAIAATAALVAPTSPAQASTQAISGTYATFSTNVTATLANAPTDWDSCKELGTLTVNVDQAGIGRALAAAGYYLDDWDVDDHDDTAAVKAQDLGGHLQFQAAFRVTGPAGSNYVDDWTTSEQEGAQDNSQDDFSLCPADFNNRTVAAGVYSVSGSIWFGTTDDMCPANGQNCTDYNPDSNHAFYSVPINTTFTIAAKPGGGSNQACTSAKTKVKKLSAKLHHAKHGKKNALKRKLAAAKHAKKLAC